MGQQKSNPLILMLMGLAVVSAAILFLAVSSVQNRPQSPEGSEVVTVGGQPITLRRDAAQTLVLVNNALPVPPPPQPEQVDPQPAPTDPTAVPTTPPETAEQQQPAPAPTQTAVPQPQPAPAAVEKIIFIDYQVQQSDTLYSIAQRIDTSIALMADKGISHDSLVPGTIIRLPIGNPAYCPGRRPYAIGEGDTVFSIGRRFNISKEDLQTINNLDANFSIRIADILCVP